jgi:hypothetical protein
MRALVFGGRDSSAEAEVSTSLESSRAISSEVTISGSLGSSGFGGSGDRAGAAGRFAYFARDSPGSASNVPHGRSSLLGSPRSLLGSPRDSPRDSAGRDSLGRPPDRGSKEGIRGFFPPPPPRPRSRSRSRFSGRSRRGPPGRSCRSSPTAGVTSAGTAAISLDADSITGEIDTMRSPTRLSAETASAAGTGKGAGFIAGVNIAFFTGGS